MDVRMMVAMVKAPMVVGYPITVTLINDLDLDGVPVLKVQVTFTKEVYKFDLDDWVQAFEEPSEEEMARRLEEEDEG